MKVKSESEVPQSCPTLRDFMDCSPDLLPIRISIQQMSLVVVKVGENKINPNSFFLFFSLFIKGIHVIIILAFFFKFGFPLKNVSPHGSDTKVSACNAGDPGWIPGSGSSSGEGNGYPLQYSCLKNSMVRGAWQATVHGVTKSLTEQPTLSLFKECIFHVMKILKRIDHFMKVTKTSTNIIELR